MKFSNFFNAKKALNTDKKNKVFFAVVVIFIVIAIVWCYLNEKDSRILKIGFVTDWEYSGEKRVNNKMGEVADEYLKKVVDHYNKKFHPDIVIGGGDYIAGSRVSNKIAREQIRDIIGIFSRAQGQIYYTIGSRDIRKISRDELLEDLGIDNPYYCKERDGFKLIFLDTSMGYIDSRQLKWLEESLKTKKPVLVFSHKGFIEVPNGDTWGKNIKNDDEVRGLLEKTNNVVAVVSGNASVDFIEKKNNIPYIFVAGLTNPNKQLGFADIAVNHKSNKDIKLTLKKYHNRDYLEYLIERNFADGAVTRIKKIKEINKNNTVNSSWRDVGGGDSDNGTISEGKGGETNVGVTEGGILVASFEDKANNERIRVRYFKDGNWIDIEDKKNPKGLVSFGKGDTPCIETKKEEIFVSFTEYDRNERPRVIKWNGNNWYDLADANYPEGFLSKYTSHEPVISFDKSETYLYAVFEENKTEDKTKSLLKMMRWDGNGWSVVRGNNGREYINNSFAREADIKHSNMDDSMYIAYEDILNGNKIRVLKWNGEKFSLLCDNQYLDGFVGNIKGYSPAITIDGKDNLYLVFSIDKPGKTLAFMWNGKKWNEMGQKGIVTSKNTIESTIIADNKSDDIFVAYSEYKDNVVRKRVCDDGKEELRKKGIWRVKIRKWENSEWHDVEDCNNGYISNGNGKGDPSLVIFDDVLYVIFTDEESGNRARVKAYSFKSGK